MFNHQSQLFTIFTAGLLVTNLGGVAPVKAEAAPKTLSKEERKYLALESMLLEFQACAEGVEIQYQARLMSQEEYDKVKTKADLDRAMCGQRLYHQLEDKVVIDDRKPNMNIHHRASMLDLYTALYTKCMHEKAKNTPPKAAANPIAANCIGDLRASLDSLNKTVPPVAKFEAIKGR
ncbi:MAG TPA: hypothetical protein VJJ83_01010 [Candidatus Babeliales bacterium]|nr:hypothetical protein [Candidatus Babeliales bacterium]